MAQIDREQSGGETHTTSRELIFVKGHGMNSVVAENPATREPAVVSGQKLSLSRKIRAYIHLTKPQVIELLLVTTAPTMIFAAGGFPNLWLILNTLVGGAMAAGASGAFNCYIDRESDRKMKRTEKRPLVTGELSDREALIFAWVLAVVSIIYLWVFVNPLAATLGLVAIFLYVVFYSIFLKRRTSQNIVWGGLAGCMPVFIAWAAVTNSLSWAAVVLFTVIFLWTPPHYWPLSMKYAEDYKAAGIPMLGAIATAKSVSVQVVLYGWAMVICSLLLIPVGGAGWVYTLSALIAGGWFLYNCHKLHRLAVEEKATSRTAMTVFHGSITYLTVLFIALAIDPFVGGPVMTGALI